MSYSGVFLPTNPVKYVGKIGKIIWRSTWELRFMQFLDTNPNVISWASEEIKIPYYHPIKQKIANYIPDFLIKYQNKFGQINTELIEIKPKSETVVSKKTKPNKLAIISVNHAKWEAAKQYCDNVGIAFRILTESELFKGKK